VKGKRFVPSVLPPQILLLASFFISGFIIKNPPSSSPINTSRKRAEKKTTLCGLSLTTHHFITILFSLPILTHHMVGAMFSTYSCFVLVFSKDECVVDLIGPLQPSGSG